MIQDTTAETTGKKEETNNDIETTKEAKTAKKSTKTPNINESLWLVQQELKVPKDLYNKFSGYYYRNAETILIALKPVLKKYKLTVTFQDDVFLVGNHYYVRSTCQLTDIRTGDKIETTAWAREEEQKPKMDSSQVTGSCSSYARKYALNAMFLIDDVKDSDTTNDGTQNHQQNPNNQQNQNNQQNKQNVQNQAYNNQYGNNNQQYQNNNYQQNSQNNPIQFGGNRQN